MSIFSHIPNGYKLRDVQEHTLKELESNWDEYDVFVVDAAVASGKSLLAITISNWRNAVGESAAVLTPRTILQDQYTRDYSDIPTLKGKAQYTCTKIKDTNCSDVFEGLGRYCCGGGCVYKKAVVAAQEAPKSIFNFHSHLFNGMANDMYKDVLIIDEAHNLVSMLSDVYTLTLWKNKEHYKDDLHTKDDIVIFLHAKAEELEKEATNIREAKLGGSDESKPIKKRISKLEMAKARKLSRKAKKFRLVAEGIISSKEQFHVSADTKSYRGMRSDCITIKPLSLKLVPHQMWPDGKVKKMVLMSATIYDVDMERLGLDRKRVKYIKTGSPIPKENRPVIINPVASMSFANIATALPLIANKINELSEVHQGKGVVHITYGLATAFRRHLTSGRYLWHNEDNKDEIYKEFCESDGNPILMACGMSEGIDLVGESYQWQVIAKVMFPSLQDSYQKHILTTRPDIYSLETARTIVQQVGRICRTPTDVGTSYILDANFKFFYYKNYKLFPEYFQEALKWER